MHGLVGKVGLHHGGWAGEERAAVREWHGLSCLCVTLQPMAERHGEQGVRRERGP